jgi:pyruvate dehydrogenase E2 component (dihydrolipoamide acetyltransferase)
MDLNIDKLLEMRKSINDLALINDKGKPNYKLSVNDIIIKATALALKSVPEANSSWSDDAVLLYNNIDISVAVAIDGGLITPIIKNADQKSLIDISNEAKKLIKKARDGKLQPEEFQGGSFSISNLGMYGINNFQAIVNPPQSCILAVGAGIEKAIIKDGDFAKATIMNITLSSDHRSVDGSVGAEFLGAFKKIIENPISMLL